MLKFMLLFAFITITIADFKRDCLNRHNELREQHHTGSLKLGGKVQKYAQNWANELANTDTFKHSGGKYGENIYEIGGTKADGESVVNYWYSEIKDYDWDHPEYSDDTGHFTQVLWKGSTELGCAKATNGKNTYVVASYDPPGNSPNKFKENVLEK